jgi:hypothetical protein
MSNSKQHPVKIESEIPMPNNFSWAAIGRAMKVGDSVEVENRKQANALSVALYQGGFRAIHRVTVFPKIRVWKAIREKPTMTTFVKQLRNWRNSGGNGRGTISRRGSRKSRRPAHKTKD